MAIPFPIRTHILGLGFIVPKLITKQREIIIVNSSARYLTAIVALVAVSTTLLSAQTGSLKVGFVDSDVIFQQYPEAQAIQKKLDATVKSWRDSIDLMTQEYQTKLDEYQKKQALATEQYKQQTEQELLGLRQRILDFQNDKFGQGGELARQQDKLLGPVKEKIIKAIEEVAKEEGFNFVLDRNDQFLIVLYGDSRFDLTFKVLDRLKRGSSGTAK